MSYLLIALGCLLFGYLIGRGHADRIYYRRAFPLWFTRQRHRLQAKHLSKLTVSPGLTGVWDTY